MQVEDGGFEGPGATTFKGFALQPILPGATYYSQVLNNNDNSPDAEQGQQQRYYDAARSLDFQHGRGITRAAGAPWVRSYDAAKPEDGSAGKLPPWLEEIASLLVGSGVLRTWPKQISVNHYATPSHEYEMVPHKDGYADQAAIVSLGSDTLLEFWAKPASEAEKTYRKALFATMKSHYSGTDVFESLVGTEPTTSVWLEPGSVLVCEGGALEEFAHGLQARSTDAFAPVGTGGGGSGGGVGGGSSSGGGGGAVANAIAVSAPRLAARAAASSSAASEPPERIIIQRGERVSIVLWTPYTGHLK